MKQLNRSNRKSFQKVVLSRLHHRLQICFKGSLSHSQFIKNVGTLTKCLRWNCRYQPYSSTNLPSIERRECIKNTLLSQFLREEKNKHSTSLLQKKPNKTTIVIIYISLPLRNQLEVHGRVPMPCLWRLWGTACAMYALKWEPVTCEISSDVDYYLLGTVSFLLPAGDREQLNIF